MRNYFLYFIILGFAFSACTNSQEQVYNIVKTAYSEKGMVVSAHPLATEVGVNIMREGGNAVDASIAVQFALAVVFPRAGNIGGGGFMVYRPSSGEATTLDFREKAPKLATRDMYLDSAGNVIPDLSTIGHLAVGVPGTVEGLFEAHARYGSLPMNKLIAPAIKLATQGYRITEYEAERLNRYRDQLELFNDASCPFTQSNGKVWEAGNLIVQDDLASTLELIALEGANGFYQGVTARKIVDEVQGNGGIITLEDLSSYNAVWRSPIESQYKNYNIISMPPPSSGGVALAQLLDMVEPFPLSKWGFHDPRSIHLMAEVERRAFSDRAMYLGDMDFIDVPIDTLLDQTYIEERMSDFNSEAATSSQDIEAGEFKLNMESYETTHVSIVDTEGNAVSVTTTLNSNFGSKVMVDGAGFFLNNEMDDFSAKPGIPNQFGLIGAEANAIVPEKRMLSSMTPTIIEKDGDLYLVLGTPGGATIITSVFQVFLNVAEFDMSISEAVQAKRFHHQWLPDEIITEKFGFDEIQSNALRGMGHTIREVGMIGIVKAIHKLPNGDYEGAADPRADDHASGI